MACSAQVYQIKYARIDSETFDLLILCLALLFHLLNAFRNIGPTRDRNLESAGVLTPTVTRMGYFFFNLFMISKH